MPAAQGASAAPSPSTSTHPPHGFHRPTHRFEDAAAWSARFDAPERDAWQQPDVVLRELALPPAAIVADIGAGTGYFTLRLARAVPQGRVIAVDIEPSLLRFIEERAQREHLTNIVTRQGAPDDPRLEPPVDLALVVNTYHHIEDRVRYFSRVRAALGPRGKLVVIDWRMGKLPEGPPDEHKLPTAIVAHELTQVGFQRCGSYEGLVYQYWLTFAERCPELARER